MSTPRFAVKTNIPPAKFAAVLNTQDGLGYDCDTIIPDKEHTSYTLIFRRRPEPFKTDEADFEAMLAALSKDSPESPTP